MSGAGTQEVRKNSSLHTALEQEEEVAGGGRTETQQLGSGKGIVGQLEKMQLRWQRQIHTPSLPHV